MGDIDIRSARDRIETVEKRIAAMHDAGVDVAALRAQLAFAHHALREGRTADIEAICDEVLSAARRLAELGTRASQVRTPAHGTPALQVRTPAHGIQVPPQETGTEAMQRVKVGRAQLADEVRAAIDAEVKTQMSSVPAVAASLPTPVLERLNALENRLAQAPAQPDLSPIANRLDALESRLTQVPEPPPAPAPPDLTPLASRLEALEEHLADLRTQVPAQPDLTPIADRLDALEGRISAGQDQGPLIERLAALEARLADVVERSQGAATSGLHGLDERMAALEARPSIDGEAISSIVRTTVDEIVPRQASELLREAISKLPTRDDLHQIAETLRADLDWRLEKAAAEHGWCSLADVQTTVRKSMAEQDPTVMAGGSQLGRLEIAMAEFVQQSKEQQERLIAALADRVVRHTKSLTKRMLVRDAPVSEAAKTQHDTEELSPSFSSAGEGSSRMAAITSVARESSPGKAQTDLALDPVPAEILEASRREHGGTTLYTQRVQTPPSEQPQGDDVVQTAAMPQQAEPSQAEKPVDLHDLVTAEVERALHGAAASTMTELTGAGDGSSAAALPIAIAAAAPSNRQPAASTPQLADLTVQIAAEVGRQLAMTVPVNLPPSDSDLARAVARVLPQALQDEAVRDELFAVLALEAAGKPGVLGELTGLRRFLKRELQQAVDQISQQAPVL